MKLNLKLPKQVEQFSGVIYFIIILLVSNTVWKLTVIGDESDTIVNFLSLDISAPFNWMSTHVASLTYKIVSLLGYEVNLENEIIIRHLNDNAVRVTWACSGLKQTYIMICIIAFYKGSIQKKLWYIPFTIFIVYLFNIFRIVVLAIIVKNHPEWFDFLHEELLKYMFYLVIFGLWVLWEEKIRRVKTNQ